jgi:hypothetical protein
MAFFLEMLVIEPPPDDQAHGYRADVQALHL